MLNVLGETEQKQRHRLSGREDGAGHFTGHVLLFVKNSVPVAVRVRRQPGGRSCCHSQMLLLGCCGSQVLVLHWLYCLPFRVYLVMPFVSMPTIANPFFPIRAHSFIVCDQ